MQKTVKIITLSFLIFLLLSAGVLTYLTTAVDPEQVKQQIYRMVKEKTGRTMTIAGKVDFSIFPRLGINVGKTTLGNAPGFSGEFADIEKMRAGLQILPLFSKKIQTTALVVDGLVVRLHRRKDGRTNWDNLAGGKKVAGQPDKKQKKTFPAMAFLLEGIEVKNSTVTYQDDAAALFYGITGFSLTTGVIGADRPIPVTGSFTVAATKPESTTDVAFSTTLLFDSTARKLLCNDLSIRKNARGKGLPVTVSSLLSGNIGYDPVKKNISSAGLSLGIHLEGDRLPEKKADLTLTTPVEITLDPLSVTLPALAMKVPGSSITGSASYETRTKKNITFALEIDRIDLNRFIAPVAVPKPVAQRRQDPSAMVRATAPGPYDDLTIRGAVVIGTVKKDTLRASNIVVRAAMDNSVLKITPCTAELYSGLLSCAATVDFRGTFPKVAAKAALKELTVGEALAALTGKEMMTGIVDLDADVDLIAADRDTLAKSLNGAIRLTARDGAVHGINIPALIRQAKAALKGEKIPPDTARQTDFTAMAATVKFTDGRATNDDFTMRSPLLRLTGKGWADLVQSRLDYRITARIADTVAVREETDLKKLRDLPIPIRISGGLARPAWSVDLASLFRKQAEKSVRDVVAEVVKDPKKALKDPKKLLENKKKALEGLKRLFK